jgi:hypothetical protein
MNKHFEDAQYYLKRAGETATKGVKEELEPLEERFRSLTGGEDEPKPSRLEELRADLKAVQAKAEGEATGAVRDAREKIADYRMTEA